MTYLHLGSGVLTDEKELIGIFDLDNLTSSEEGTGFLRTCEKKGTVESIGGSFDLPKSLIVTERDGKEKVFLSPITTLTLWKRSRETGSDLF